MKRNSSDFSTPQHQSIEGIALNIFKTINVVFRKILPVLLVFLVGNGDKRHYLIIGLITIALIGIIGSIIRYFRYTFYIKGDKLIVNKGILKRERLSIPFDRIQAVNFEQNIVHQVLDVVAIKIDSAGSKGAEIEMTSLKKEVASALRDKLLSKATKPNIELSKKYNVPSHDKLIVQLEFIDLIKAGLVENHLKSIGILLATVFGFYQNITEAFKIEDQIENQVNKIDQSLYITLAVFATILILGLVISMGRIVFIYFNLKFIRVSNGFKIHGGLFKKRNISALDHKIQVFSYADNPLKKIIGVYDLVLKQASSKEVSTKKSIHVPSISLEKIEEVKYLLFKGLKFPTEKIKIQKQYIIRMLLFIVLVWLAILAPSLYFKEYYIAVICTIAAIIMGIRAILKYRRSGYSYNEDMLIIHGGSFGDKKTLVPIFKLQSLEIVQTPYQQRKNLADVTFYTASGEISIHYITLNEAHTIFNYFTYLIETSKREWI